MSQKFQGFVCASSLDTIRIEVIGEGRAVAASGGQWVAFREQAIDLVNENARLSAEVSRLQEELTKAIA